MKSSGVAQFPLFDSGRLRTLEPTSWEAQQVRVKHEMDVILTDGANHNKARALFLESHGRCTELQVQDGRLSPGNQEGVGLGTGVAGARQSVVGRKGSWASTHRQLIILAVSAAERRGWLAGPYDGIGEISSVVRVPSNCRNATPGFGRVLTSRSSPSADCVTAARARTRAPLIAVARSGLAWDTSQTSEKMTKEDVGKG